MNKIKKGILRSSLAIGLALAAASVSQAISLVGTGSFGGSQYRIYQENGISWSESNAAATGLGGGWRLVSVTSLTEHDYLVSLLNSIVLGERHHYFIGLTDAATEGVYEWTSGEAFSFSAWHGGEPNDLSAEDYVAYDSRNGVLLWNDLPDDSYDNLQKGFIAERVPDAGTTAGLLLASVLALGCMRRRLRG